MGRATMHDFIDRTGRSFPASMSGTFPHLKMLRRNVLIFHSGALGDFVLSWPLALALGRLHPQSRVIYVTAASKGALAERVLRVESADAESGWQHLHGDAASLPERCARTLAGAHSVYAFASPQDDWWRANIVKIAGESALTKIRPIPPEGFAGHATDHLLAELSALPATQTAVRQILSSIAAKGIGTLRPTAIPADAPVTIHPGSGSRGKCWPVARFVELIGRIRQSGKNVRVLLGEVEEERFTQDEMGTLESAAGPGAIVKPPTYLALLNELAAAHSYIGNDSGPTHLAAIISVPTLALFGPTDPAVWRPLGPLVKTLHMQPLASLEADRAYEPWNALATPPERRQ
jgi:heptosyltransferase III